MSLRLRIIFFDWRWIRSAGPLLCLLVLTVPGISEGAGAELPEGLQFERGDSRPAVWLMVTENRFRLYFLGDNDGEDEPTFLKPDILRAIIQYSRPMRSGDRAILLPATDGEGRPMLRSRQHINPPFIFHGRLILVDDGPEESSEIFPFSYRDVE